MNTQQKGYLFTIQERKHDSLIRPPAGTCTPELKFFTALHTYTNDWDSDLTINFGITDTLQQVVEFQI